MNDHCVVCLCQIYAHELKAVIMEGSKFLRAYHLKCLRELTNRAV